MILVNIAGLAGFGSATLPRYDDGNWFAVNSFSFGVEREMRESGDKGGTEDINIGVGELQFFTIAKVLDKATPKLAQSSVNGNNLGIAEIHFLDEPAEKTAPYMAYRLDRCFVKSWSTSGDADDRPTEEVAFYYNRVAFKVAGSAVFSWDNVANKVWDNHGLPNLPDPKQ